MRKNFNPSRIPGCQEIHGRSPLLLKGTSRREKVRKNLNPSEKSKPTENSRSQPHTYLRNIQKGKKEKKSWYQYIFLKVAGRSAPTGGGGKLWNLHFSLEQRRQRTRESIQPIVQVLAKNAVPDHLSQVAVGCYDESNVDASGKCAAHRFGLAFLEDATQLGLKFARHVANFIEKQRATMRPCKAADVRGDRTRERSSFVAEKFAFVPSTAHHSC